MEFIPDDSQGPTLDVPYYGEARAEDGWQGQSTSLSFDSLKRDISETMARLGGVVHTIQRGTYHIGGLDRPGVQVHYSVEGPGGQMAYGRLDIAALPVKSPAKRHGWKETLRNWEDNSLRMALYNVVQALKAQWVLKQLNPAYVPLMPWLLDKHDRTLTEAFADSGYSKALMPPEGGDFVQGEFKESLDD